MAIPPTWLNPHSDPIFGLLWQRFHDVAPGAQWESLSPDGHEKNHCVWVRWKGQAHGIGFAHELAALSKEQFATLLGIYFSEGERVVSETKVYLVIDGERQDLIEGREFTVNQNVVTLSPDVTSRIATYKAQGKEVTISIAYGSALVTREVRVR